MSLVLERAIDVSTDSKRSQEISPLSEKFYNFSLVDTTNLAVTTYYFPSSSGFVMDGYKSLSITGILTDADGNLTLTFEASNDEDSVNANFASIYGYDSQNDVMVNSVAVVSSSSVFSVDFDNLNYRIFRVKLVVSGNTNTVIIKARLISL